ncbi:histone-like nucleoid-structuring protein Lsr2 [Salinispora arenicola]|uniref:Lsr2 dimerization domain-containing protein n=1 Tax=Salinispora arenicola TaxID=168697 RepID=UPI00036E995B|nr:histone-like nucleoid-structuring protein Lsr2 [Salinispora arenicola]
MATKTIFVVTDDLDHSQDNVGTYRFAPEGVEYEIGLSAHNLVRMREAFAPYVEAGRRLPKQSLTRRGSGTRDGCSVNAGLREFWSTHEERQGLPPHRSYGPIPREVRDAYRNAH